MSNKYFTNGVFAFLKDLEANNNKEWWEANKDRYIQVIREPALDFIEEFGERLQGISPHFRGDTRLNGGSLMRPYRDVRFSKDKTPYKTNVGIQFRHESGKDVHAPGFYVHFGPSTGFAGVGMWTPETAVARQIRQAINDDPIGWGEAAHSDTFTKTWSLRQHEQDRLKRVSKEFDPNHPYPDDLRLKSFTAGTKITQKLATSNDFGSELFEKFEAASDYTRFLCQSIGVPF